MFFFFRVLKTSAVVKVDSVLLLQQTLMLPSPQMANAFYGLATTYYQEEGRKIVGVTTRLLAIQRLVEIKYVSEQLNFKICTLLLHSGKVIESVAWFRQHKNAYKRLVGKKMPTPVLGCIRNIGNIELADHYLGQKRSSLELVISTTETSSDTNSADSVVLLTYVGRFARILELGDNVDMMA
ncbi:hypothetical protein Ahy_A10g050785 [Arachis hypogaea]|uniref:Trafficking protein particle complex subunit 11 domain-containing protein n=1 Tax=Arachis hypogaea TaxID=3818 RepID=A0A445BAG8_ARAHY|nr:hypothetical protein Ahy_A10g050785 [Arachis hypogaea]